MYDSKWDQVGASDSEEEEPESALTTATRLRAQGNRLFAAKDLQAAQQAYQGALQAVLALEPSPQATDLQHACLLNLAAAALELSDPSDALQHAAHALALRPGDGQARKLRGGALMALGNLSAALTELRAAAAALPEDAGLTQTIAELSAQEQIGLDSPPELMDRAAALWKQGDRAGAVGAWREQLLLLEAEQPSVPGDSARRSDRGSGC